MLLTTMINMSNDKVCTKFVWEILKSKNYDKNALSTDCNINSKGEADFNHLI